MRIGIDIDGVLANFNLAYIKLLNEISGKNEPLDHQPTRWHYEAELGFTANHVTEAWKRIEESETFWHELEEIKENTDYLRDWGHTPATGEEVYFITARPGKMVKLQTEDWLRSDGDWNSIWYLPTVLISSAKGLCAKALNLDIYIDDRTENIRDVQETSPSTRAYLINRSYNEGGDVLRRANTLSDVFKREGLLSE